MTGALPVLGFEGLYSVDALGRVFSHRTGRYLAGFAPPGRHVYVTLRDRDGRQFSRAVHRLVLEAFVGPRPDGMCARHLDGDRQNNTLTNLAWGTYSENNSDTVRHGNNRWASRTHCKHGHEYTEENTRISSRGRECRACGRAKYHARKRRIEGSV